MSSANTSSIASSGGLSTGDRILAALQTLGRSLMLPIAVLPAAALLLRFGQADMLQLVGLTQQQLPWLGAAGNAVFGNLPLIFAIGIVIGLTGEAGASSIAALIGFLVFTGVFNTVIPQVKGAPDPNINMGVLSGILIGVVSAWLYRRFYDIRLPDYLAFFGGKRFVPIITAFVALILGLIFGWIWPTIQIGINAVGVGIVSLGAVGVGIYGFLNRLLIPLGLHHVLNTYVWFQLGTYHGATGDLNRYFVGDPTAGHFMAGFFPIMMFGLPAAALAMIRHARFSKVAAGILLSAAFTSFLTGVTEPIEFAFIFVAPLLFVIHALLTGTALAVCYLLNIKIGFGFSAGLIDYLLNFGKSNTTNPLLLLVVGVVYAVIYYFLFSFFITRFDLATPGRGEASTGLSADWILPESQRGPRKSAKATSEATAEEIPVSEDRDDVLARNVLAALGGKENVKSVEGCITRLRLFVEDPTQIDDTRLKSLGASGVIKRGKIAQVVLGTQSDRIAERIKRLMKARSSDDASE
ncbi:MAG TPA: PTS transporter subunit EIIC [Ktedonobacteraceae bacterium]|nr:PTS transporter subunit EIIC [Ktedonobacteraceae bacterium]